MLYIGIIKHKEGHVMEKEMKFSREIVEKYITRVKRCGFETVYPGENWNTTELKSVVDGSVQKAVWYDENSTYSKQIEVKNLLNAVSWLRENVTTKKAELLVFLRALKKEIVKTENWTWDGSPHITGYKEGGAE
jgi:hypothetical protein